MAQKLYFQIHPNTLQILAGPTPKPKNTPKLSFGANTSDETYAENGWYLANYTSDPLPTKYHRHLPETRTVDDITKTVLCHKAAEAPALADHKMALTSEAYALAAQKIEAIDPRYSSKEGLAWPMWLEIAAAATATGDYSAFDVFSQHIPGVTSQQYCQRMLDNANLWSTAWNHIVAIRGMHVEQIKLLTEENYLVYDINVGWNKEVIV